MVKLSKAFKYFLSITTGIILGMIIGVASLSVFVSYRIDKYHQEIEYLKNVIEDKEVRLAKLEESINKRRFILKSIEIIIITEGDDIDKIELEKYLKEKYNMLIGKEVKNIDIDILSQIVDNRLMRVNDKEYKISVKKIFLTDILKIWVETKLIE
ncbi:MAG: hypothetical protein FH751_03595 [Firmicutes bacterium]|nr:hypothetical protein [Bacillota bacterium]